MRYSPITTPRLAELATKAKAELLVLYHALDQIAPVVNPTGIIVADGALMCRISASDVAGSCCALLVAPTGQPELRGISR